MSIQARRNLLMASPLLSFLAQARSAVLRPLNSSLPSPTLLTLVLGNPSCDLDSFISATVFSFFYSRKAKISQPPRLYIPVLNLPSISSGELWRLRPEFGTALCHALNLHESGEKKPADDANKSLLENLLTVSDIRSASSSALHHLFCKSSTEGKAQTISTILVDHNALSIQIPDISSAEISSNFDIVGCIDHHIDEASIPSGAFPRIIQTGIGSCACLVIKHLRDVGLWQDTAGSNSELPDDFDVVAAELAKLSLASILIDTTNLTAEEKVSDIDRETACFLEKIIQTAVGKTQSQYHSLKQPFESFWDRNQFYEQIASSKANSLDLLTLTEIFGRDYKNWSEKTSISGTELNLGIASVVKPIKWLIKKAASSSPEHFLIAAEEFAKGQRPSLDLLAIMTTSTDHVGHFRRELLVLATGETKDPLQVLDTIEDMTNQGLELVQWTNDQSLVDLLQQKRHSGKIWWQNNVYQSRKQVAPLLREAIKSVKIFK